MTTKDVKRFHKEISSHRERDFYFPLRRSLWHSRPFPGQRTINFHRLSKNLLNNKRHGVQWARVQKRRGGSGRSISSTFPSDNHRGPSHCISICPTDRKSSKSASPAGLSVFKAAKRERERENTRTTALSNASTINLACTANAITRSASNVNVARAQPTPQETG